MAYKSTRATAAEKKAATAPVEAQTEEKKNQVKNGVDTASKLASAFGTLDKLVEHMNRPAEVQPTIMKQMLDIQAGSGVSPISLKLDSPRPRKSDLYPVVSTFTDQADMDEAVALMRADLDYQEQASAVAEARGEIKQRLSEIARKYSIPGFRWGHIAVSYNGEKTRRTLSSKLLAENGVLASTINASYTTSKPFQDLRITDLNKPRSRGGAEGGEEEE